MSTKRIELFKLAMSQFHFLNVKQGDCSVIHHNSGHISIIDVCNAKPVEPVREAVEAVLAKAEPRVLGNFQQKKYPVNPISYLKEHGVTSVFRYVQTHPDMDHMDGIKEFFRTFGPVNFWDTNNKKEIPGSEWDCSAYRREDWEFYKNLRDTEPDTDPKRLALLSGARGQYYNVGADGQGGGDGLQVLAPTQTLVNVANEVDEDYNRSSYVLLYRTAGGSRIVFGGDSHDESWDHILKYHEEAVTDVDMLIAPHHGRKSGRSYKFLDILRPTLTFFGNAQSEHLAYEAWSSRGLQIVTNNQANCMVVDVDPKPMVLYVTHEKFARAINSNTYFSESFKAWYVGPIEENLISRTVS